MEDEYLKINESTYDEISENWDTKRQHYWKPVVKFIEQIKDKKKKTFLDLGCGGGRHLELALKEGFPKENLTGSDISKNQLKIVSEKGFKTSKANLTELPFEDESFDEIVCIAAHHHLLDKENQLNSLYEMRRILKKGGRILLANWFPEKEFLKKQIKKGKFNFYSDNKQKVRVTYTLDGKKLDRYYYLFEENELIKLCQKAGFGIEKKEYYNGNLYLTLN